MSDTTDQVPDIADELDYIAGHLAMFTKAEMAVIMRDAANAIRLRNSDALPLDEETEEGLQKFMAAVRADRNEAVRRIVWDWLVGHGFVEELVLDEDSETKGTA